MFAWDARFFARARVLIVAIFFTGCVTPGSAAPVTQRAASPGLKAALQRDLDAYLKTRGAKEHVSALSLAVSLDAGQPAVDVAAGTTRYRSGVAVTPANLFQIGSNTKAFTAVAVLQLEARGRLSIDAPIGAYLPRYPTYAKLTLRQLLNMTGGIASYDNTSQWKRLFLRNPMANVPTDTLIRMVYPAFESIPGTKYSYSNTGYLLAQEIVAARSDTKSFPLEMARIIRSAGLHDTSYISHLYPGSIASRVVAGYYENDDPGWGGERGRDLSGASLSWAQGAGSIVSTPHDLTIWARQLYTGTALLPPKQKRELESFVSVKTAKPPAQATAADPGGFGLGVAQRFDPKLGTFWLYLGETLGFRAAHLYFPKTGPIIALFANSRPTAKQSGLQALFATLNATITAHAKDLALPSR